MLEFIILDMPCIMLICNYTDITLEIYGGIISCAFAIEISNIKNLQKKIEQYKDLYNFDEIIPISAYKRDNVDRLISVLKSKLTDNIKYYEDGAWTNVSTRFLISELIREKILELTDEEVPHSVSVVVDQIEYNNNAANINATIVVDRENLKKILVGKNGSMIKEIGIRARKDIESLLGKNVYLDLFVKVIPKWRDREKFLNEIGFKEFNFDKDV